MNKFVQWPDPILNQKCSKMFFSPFTLDLIAADLFSFLGESFNPEENGILGIAANQIGDLRNYFIFWDGETYDLAVNSSILKESPGKESKPEMCLSLDHAYNVSRPLSIDASYFSYKENKFIVRELTGLIARIFCHEHDHINGKLICDYGDRFKVS